MRPAARDVTGSGVAENGRFVPEEQPEAVARRVLERVSRRE